MNAVASGEAWAQQHWERVLGTCVSSAKGQQRAAWEAPATKQWQWPTDASSGDCPGA